MLRGIRLREMIGKNTLIYNETDINENKFQNISSIRRNIMDLKGKIEIYI